MPGAETGRGDEFARLEAHLEENDARFVEQVEQLKAERNQLTALLGGMVEGVVAIDLDRQVLHLNAVAANWFRRPAPELAVGRPIYELSRQPEISGALIEAMEKRRQVSRTFTLARFAGQDGGPNRFELNASPLLSSRRDGEQVEGAVAVIHDITELERLEKHAPRFRVECLARAEDAPDRHSRLCGDPAGRGSGRRPDAWPLPAQDPKAEQPSERPGLRLAHAVADRVFCRAAGEDRRSALAGWARC